MAQSYIENLLGDREKIILVARKHWLVLLNNILVEIFLVVVIAILAVVLGIFFPLLFNPIGMVVALVLLLVPFLGGLHDTIVWLNHQYILTNWRVIQVEGVYSKTMTDSSLEKVNDVKLVQTALGRMFNYGDIQILTASEMGVATFQRIGDPVRFKIAMVNAKEQFEHGDNRAESRAEVHGEPGLDPEDIPAMIARLDNLRGRGIITDEEFKAKKTELLSKM